MLVLLVKALITDTGSITNWINQSYFKNIQTLATAANVLFMIKKLPCYKRLILCLLDKLYSVTIKIFLVNQNLLSSYFYYCSLPFFKRDMATVCKEYFISYHIVHRLGTNMQNLTFYMASICIPSILPFNRLFLLSSHGLVSYWSVQRASTVQCKMIFTVNKEFKIEIFKPNLNISFNINKV
jgi:hypothetical protein